MISPHEKLNNYEDSDDYGENRQSNPKPTITTVQKDSILKKGPEYPEEEAESSTTPTTPEPKKPQTDSIGDKKETPLVNTRYLSKYARTYELEKFDKNILLIFNHEFVVGQDRREGTDKDVADLKATFKNCGFEVQEESNLSYEKIKSKLQTFTSQDFTNYGCIAVAVLTHGRNDGLIMASDMVYNELEIVYHLHATNRPTLLTKPRILIIQACRGRDSLKGSLVGQPQGTQKDTGETHSYTLPVESDLLVFHSSYIGKASHRHPENGSWCIQALCSKINQLSATTDLDSILTEVKREVAIDKMDEEWNSKSREFDINKQMPVTMSSLTRKLYFKNYIGTTMSESVSDYAQPIPSPTRPATDATPSTPMVHEGSCLCFLHHFHYIRNCLRYFVEENPGDSHASWYLDIVDGIEDGPCFNTLKYKTAKVICSYLRTHGCDKAFFKYVYLYNH